MPSQLLTETLTYLTADQPGTGGVIKQRNDDFSVTEVPLYEPCGEGEHLYLYIEKNGRTTSEVVQRICRAFHVKRSAVGYAGLKDKHAVTRQHFSVYLPDKSADQMVSNLEGDEQVKVFWADRHTNKLRRGHLKGNRFEIKIRDVQPSDVLTVRRMLEQLGDTGVPNFIGHQRFGYRQTNHIIGGLMLRARWQELLDRMLGDPGPSDGEATRIGREAYERGEYATALEHWPKHLRHDRQALDPLRQGKPPRDAVMNIDPTQRDFFIAAWQSHIFNQVLDARVQDATFCRLCDGDLAFLHGNRAVFAVDPETAELENGPDGRIASFEVSPSGPMWGKDMTWTKGAVGELEERKLADSGMTKEMLEGVEGAPVAHGSRRPLRVPVIDPDYSGGADEHGPYLRVAFELPRGSYATVVLREIMKNEGLEREAYDRSGTSHVGDDSD